MPHAANGYHHGDRGSNSSPYSRTRPARRVTFASIPCGLPGKALQKVGTGCRIP
jgi:hypothetical protein